MAHRSDDLRNLALVGAGGAGKTTLAEALLHLAGITNRRGTVPEKNTVSDFDPDEKERQHSILAAPLHLSHEGKEINLIDAPGAVDFLGEAISALSAVEIAAVCVNAHDGIGVATRRIYKSIRETGLPCCVVVTRVDSENVDGEALWASIQQVFGEQAVLLNLPDRFGPDVTRVVDVFADDVPDDLREAAARWRKQATERVVEVDDALLEKYFADETVTTAELEAAFPKALREGNIVPVLHVSVEKEVGLSKFLTFIVHDCPRPSGAVIRPALDAEGQAVEVDPEGPFSGQVWKIQVDPHVGKVAFLRVWSGLLTGKSQFTVARTGQVERIGDLLRVQGREMTPVPQAVAGDLVAVAKVDDIRVGDTVHDGTATWTFAPLATPVPKVTVAVDPKKRGDEAKLAPELQRLAEADPTFVSEREEGTHELVVRGLSSLHVDLMLRRLARKKVEVVTRVPRVPYQETLAGKGQAQYRHKKQTGGRGQFAEVHLRVEPLERGGGIEFVDEIVGGVIPRQFIPAVEKGVRETCAKGVIAGYPFTDVRATVFYGKHHDVDSDEFSFKLAASQALREAIRGAKPVLLEPILEVEIEVPARFMGAINGDLNSRRGRLLGMNQEGEVAVIKAHVPLAEMLQYSTELRSLTAGEGDYASRFDHYEPVPGNLQEEIVARHKRQLEEAQA